MSLYVHDWCPYANEGKAHRWAFDNLSLSGKLIEGDK